MKLRYNSKRDLPTSISMYVVPLNTPPKKCESLKSTDKFKSRRAGYGKQWRDSMPGDLVTTFASDTKHPVVDAGVIHRNYILVDFYKIVC